MSEFNKRFPNKDNSKCWFCKGKGIYTYYPPYAGHLPEEKPCTVCKGEDIIIRSVEDEKRGWLKALKWRAEELNEQILDAIKEQGGDNTRYYVTKENILTEELLKIKTEIEEVENDK